MDAPKWANRALTLRVPFDFAQGRSFDFAQDRPFGCASLDAAPFSFAPFDYAQDKQGKPFACAQGKRDRQGKQGRRYSLALDSPAPVLA